MEELTEDRIKKIYDFLNKNKQSIWNMVVSDFYGIVWLNNIIDGELELSAGNNPINTEDSIVIYQLKSKWYKQSIWNMAVSDFYGIVWSNNIIDGELELSAGNNPINTEDSIVIYQLKSKWYLDISDEILGWIRKDGKVYKYCSDGYRLLNDEEQLDDIYNCGFFYFCEDFIISDIIKEIKKKFKKEI